MRVTDNMKFTSTEVASDSASATLQATQSEVSSGTDVNQPGDDPFASEMILRYNNTIAGIDQTTKVINNSNTELQTADTSMANITNVLTQARTLAVQMSNGTYNAGNRADAVAQVTQMTSEITQALNANVNGVYVFGGTKDDKEPFDSTGTYTGDANTRQIQTSPGVMQTVSIDPAATFKGVGGGVDVYKVLSDLSTALTTNDPTGVATAISQIDSVSQQVATAHSQVGTYTNALALANTTNSAAKLTVQGNLSNVADSDIANASIRLAQAQTALQATLSAAALTFKISLVNLMS